MFCCQMIMLLAKGKVGVGFLAMLLMEIIDLVDACIKVTRPRPVPVSL